MAAALPAIAIALTAVSAYGSIRAGQAQAKGLARQATMATLEAKGKALDARAQGVEVLKQMNRANAALNARAAAGGIDPFSGSAQSLMVYNTSEGAREYYVSEDNQIIAREGGLLAAQNLMKQAKAAKEAGLFKAVGTLGQAAFTAASLGGAPSGSGGGFSGPMTYPSGGIGNSGGEMAAWT